MSAGKQEGKAGGGGERGPQHSRRREEAEDGGATAAAVPGAEGQDGLQQVGRTGEQRLQPGKI